MGICQGVEGDNGGEIGQLIGGNKEKKKEEKMKKEN